MRKKFGSTTRLEFWDEDEYKWTPVFICVCLLPSNDIRTNRCLMLIPSYSSSLLGGPRRYSAEILLSTFFLHSSFFRFTLSADER